MTKTIAGLLMVLLLSTQIACSKGTVPVATPISEPPPAVTTPSPTPQTPAPTLTPADPTPGVPPPGVTVQGPPPPAGPDVVGNIQLDVTPGEARYQPGQIIETKLTFTNVSQTPVTLNLYPPAITVTPQSNQTMVLFSVAGGTKPRELKPNEAVTVNITWNQKDNTGSQVQPGWYNITFGNISITEHNFKREARVLIQNPKGAIEKSISVNQSQTMSGIAVTLDRVDLTADRATFRLFYTPLGYTNQLTGPPVVKAEYTLGGITKYPGPRSLAALSEGIRATFSFDPVPSDAKELIFTVTQIDDLQGPWVFKIPLQ